MDNPSRSNRLDTANSPYLRQHADNPVNWQPWDEDALESARERDVPIFLSIGYAACHWCHVMEDESFSDSTVAETLNEHFVPIKVDREQRPDIDTIYMTICQLTTGSGGWPLSAWLTPEGKPFYVGTYYPRESRRGMPGFLEVLENVRQSWDNDREAIEQRADEWTAALTDRLEVTDTPDPIDDAPTVDIESVARTANRGIDSTHGGFGSGGPKFPQPVRLDLLLRGYDVTGEASYRRSLEKSLDAMASGGLYDHVGGGFHRYCVDESWTVPHFEKMLYDNAMLPRLYLDAYACLDRPKYASVVEESIEFVERELTHPDGGFFSTLDAESEDDSGERSEGAYYVWTPEDIDASIEDDLSTRLIRERFAIEEGGNFEGKTVLNVNSDRSELADRFELDRTEVDSRLESARSEMFDYRNKRPRPPRDEKVLAAWNGLMIDTAAQAAIVLGRPRYADLATDALAFVRRHLWDENRGRLSRSYESGEAEVTGYLDDYAFLGRGALSCFEATGAIEYLDFAIELTRAIVDGFWDESQNTLYYTPADGEALITRPQDLGDQSTPSAVGRAVQLFLCVDPFTEVDFESVAESVLRTHRKRIRSNPIEHASLAIAEHRYSKGVVEFTIAAESPPEAWLRRLGSAYVPDRLFAHRPPTEDQLQSWTASLGLETVPAVWANRSAKNGDRTIYVCQDFTCSEPYNEVDRALEYLTEGR